MRLAIPSVGYGDMLGPALVGWLRYVRPSDIVVATASQDAATIRVCDTMGVRTLITDVWTRGGVPFNKGGGLREAFELTEAGETCISADADVIPFGALTLTGLDPETIYGAPRYLCPTPKVLDDYLHGRVTTAKLGLINRGGDHPPIHPHTREMAAAAALKCQGYFQAFISREGRVFRDFPTAGQTDGDFAKRCFTKRAAMPGFHLLHLGQRAKANWAGRVLPEWR